MQPETRFKIKLLKLLKEEVPHGVFEKIAQRSVRGTLDIVGCVNGRAVVLELKTLDGRLDSLQVWNLKRWKKAGAYAVMVDPSNYLQIIEELKAI